LEKAIKLISSRNSLNQPN
jgi:tetratricopeptide (TPR) repeat protein